MTSYPRKPDRPEEALRKLTLNEESAIEDALGLQIAIRDGALDPRALAIARISALVAMGAAPPSYQWAGAAALSAGVTAEELTATLNAIAPIVGLARVVAAAPELALAIGYDVDAALEVLLEHDGRPASFRSPELADEPAPDGKSGAR